MQTLYNWILLLWDWHYHSQFSNEWTCSERWNNLSRNLRRVPTGRVRSSELKQPDFNVHWLLSQLMLQSLLCGGERDTHVQRVGRALLCGSRHMILEPAVSVVPKLCESWDSALNDHTALLRSVFWGSPRSLHFKLQLMQNYWQSFPALPPSFPIPHATEELMLLNCGVGEDSWESLGQQGDQTSQILKEISPEYSLEGLMLKLKLQYFGHLMQGADSLKKTLVLGKIEGRNRRGQLE